MISIATLQDRTEGVSLTLWTLCSRPLKGYKSILAQEK
jgi:hypothetical protein